MKGCRTFVYTRYPYWCHLEVAQAKFLKPSAVQVYFALLSLNGVLREGAPRSILMEMLPLTKATVYKAYDALLQFGLVNESLRGKTYELRLDPSRVREALLQKA